jgi:hypothetical protein
LTNAIPLHSKSEAVKELLELSKLAAKGKLEDLAIIYTERGGNHEFKLLLAEDGLRLVGPVARLGHLVQTQLDASS